MPKNVNLWQPQNQRQQRISLLKKELSKKHSMTKEQIHAFGLRTLIVSKRCIDIYLSELELLKIIQVKSSDGKTKISYKDATLDSIIEYLVTDQETKGKKSKAATV